MSALTKAQKQLIALLEEQGSAWVLSATANWIGGNTVAPGKEIKKKKASPKTKAGLLEAINEKFPDWELGKGKGISVAALKSALSSGEKPEKKKRTTVYFNFLAMVRAEVAELNLNPQQIIRIGSRRWTLLKEFAAENGHSTKDILESPDLLEEVKKQYSTIKEDLNGLEKPVVRKKNKKTKKKAEKKLNKISNEEESAHNKSVAGMFDLSDEDDEDDE